MTVAGERWLLGIDIGGTFTDVVAVSSSGRRVDGKVLTTPSDPLTGVLDGLELLEQRSGITPEHCDRVIHATTLATNLLIERQGADVAMLTTRGFRDIIETGHEDRYDLYDLQIETQPPLIARRRRIAIDERMDARGQVLRPLDEQALREALRELRGVSSIAICFLHAYANSEHERAAAEIARAELGDVHLSISSEVAPIIREYERFVATAVNAYVGPSIAGYVGALDRELADRGFTGWMGIMKSDGGMCAPSEATALPVRILESGPAAGILSAAATAVECGEPLAVALDMGGTTAKVCLIADGVAVMTDELEVARLKRFASGSGIPVRIPSLDLLEIGAGGGSIAWLDELGILQVGPRSAGADPGPACYGRGGTSPTVTDADLLLGYLDPADFAGGTFTLDESLARAAFGEQILQTSGTKDLTGAAWGIFDIVNENMARAVRLHCLEHGIDPASVSLIATGGAGPVHAGALLAKLGGRRVLCPPSAGVASALGLLLAARTIDVSVTDIVGVDALDDDELARRFARVEAELRARGDEDRSQFDATWFAEMRLRGQAYELRVQVPDGHGLDALGARFDREYTARFGREPWPAPREIVRWSVTLTRRHELTLEPPVTSGGRPSGSRRAFFGPEGWFDARVVDRAWLAQNGPAEGPLVIPEDGSTIVVGPRQRASVDAHANVIIERPDPTEPPLVALIESQEAGR